jgi:hypothetical protein
VRPRLVDLGEAEYQRDVFEPAGAKPLSDGLVGSHKLTDQLDLLGVAPPDSFGDERVVGRAIGLHEEPQNLTVLDQGVVGRLGRMQSDLWCECGVRAASATWAVRVFVISSDTKKTAWAKTVCLSANRR